MGLSKSNEVSVQVQEGEGLQSSVALEWMAWSTLHMLTHPFRGTRSPAVKTTSNLSSSLLKTGQEQGCHGYSRVYSTNLLSSHCASVSITH